MPKRTGIKKSRLFAQLAGYVTQKGEDIAHYYSYIEEEAKLPYYDGPMSLVHSKPGSSSNFLFIEENMKSGIFPKTKGQTSLSLLDGKRKVLYSFSHSVYHFLAEDLGNVVSFFLNDKEYSKLELIVDISGVFDVMTSKKEYDLYWFFLQSLKDKNIPHRVVNLSDFDVVYIDNFFLLHSHAYMPLDRFEDIHNYFKDYVVDKDIAPYRKVYVSRKKVGADRIRPEQIILPNGEPRTVIPSRIDDETLVEKIFSELGFEIVYPEDFKNFKEQINFFYSVKTIASITSSGMTNSIFMQPNGNMVEIITPLIARPVSSNGSPGFLNAEFHNYYKNIASTFGHFYLGIPNPNGIASEVEDFFTQNRHVSRILSDL